MPISAFVISYNRKQIIEACLRSLRFADELVVLDKGSTDGTIEIARSIADVVFSTEWSPTVEESRLEAMNLCRYDNIVFLDDDECLSTAAQDFFKFENERGFLDGYFVPCKHFILGRHSSGSYYWPERQLRAFRKGAVRFSAKVHGGIELQGRTTSSPNYSSDIYFSNLSHASVSQWLEKSNRYTSQPNRNTFFFDDGVNSYYDQMKNRLHYWMIDRTPSKDEYDQIVAALRAIYDLIDFIKIWEEKNGIDGTSEFEKFCHSSINEHLKLD